MLSNIFYGLIVSVSAPPCCQLLLSSSSTIWKTNRTLCFHHAVCRSWSFLRVQVKNYSATLLGLIANSPSSEAIANRERKVAKSSNKHGNPISMKSKVLAAISDPVDPENSIFVAESAGFARRISLAVCLPPAASDQPCTHIVIDFGNKDYLQGAKSARHLRFYRRSRE